MNASPRILNLGAALAAIGTIGAAVAATHTGSLLLLAIAAMAALVFALLQGLAFQRSAGARIDAMLAELRALGRPGNDNSGRS